MNLGNEVIEAVKRLKNNPDWLSLVAGMEVYASKAMNDAIGAPVEVRVDATAHARAVRDVWLSFESATAGTVPNQTRKPGVKFNAS